MNQDENTPEEQQEMPQAPQTGDGGQDQTPPAPTVPPQEDGAEETPEPTESGEEEGDEEETPPLEDDKDDKGQW